MKIANKLKLVVLGTALVVGSLTGCGKQDTPETNVAVQESTEQATETAEAEEGFTGIKIGTAETEDGKTTAKVVYENGNIVDIDFDESTAEIDSKYGAALSGDYKMAEGSMVWSDQVDALAKYIVENGGDTSNVKFNEDGTTVDAVSGVSIHIGNFVNAFNDAISK